MLELTSDICRSSVLDADSPVLNTASSVVRKFTDKLIADEEALHLIADADSHSEDSQEDLRILILQLLSCAPNSIPITVKDKELDEIRREICSIEFSTFKKYFP